MIVVSMSGAHSTGKTTLVKWLYDRLSKEGIEVSVILDLAREFEREELGSLEAQRNIYRNMCSELMRRKDERYEVILLDRGFIDVAAYCVHNGWLNRWSEGEWCEARELVSEIMDAERCMIDLRVFCPAENFELVDDGFRFTDEVGRWAVDLLIFSLLEAGGFRYIVYNGGGKEEVLKIIKEMIM